MLIHQKKPLAFRAFPFPIRTTQTAENIRNIISHANSSRLRFQALGLFRGGSAGLWWQLLLVAAIFDWGKSSFSNWNLGIILLIVNCLLDDDWRFVGTSRVLLPIESLFSRCPPRPICLTVHNFHQNAHHPNHPNHPPKHVFIFCLTIHQSFLWLVKCPTFVSHLRSPNAAGTTTHGRARAASSCEQRGDGSAWDGRWTFWVRTFLDVFLRFSILIFCLNQFDLKLQPVFVANLC